MATCCGKRCLRISSIVLGAHALIFFAIAIYFGQAEVQAQYDARKEREQRQEASRDPEPLYIFEFNNAVEPWQALGPDSPMKQWLPGEMRVRTYVNDTASSPTAMRSLSDAHSVKMNMCDFIVGRQKGPCYAGTSPPSLTPLNYTTWQITTAEDTPLPMPDAIQNFPPYISLSLTLNDPTAAPTVAEESARTFWNFSVTTNASKDVIFSAWCTKTSDCTVAYLNSWCLSEYGPHTHFVGGECRPNNHCGDCVVKSAVEEACFVVGPRSLRESVKSAGKGEGNVPLLPEGVRGCFGWSFMPGNAPPDNTVESAFKYHRYTVADGSDPTIPSFKITVRRSDDPSLVLQSVLLNGKSFPLWNSGYSVPPGFGERILFILSLIVGIIFTFASAIAGAISLCKKNSRSPSNLIRNARRSPTPRTKK